MSSDPTLANEAQPVQRELPFALVDGEPLSAPPEDLYIPPDALEIFLESFEGPLDLLLYLIKRQNLDILNIPIANITEQYMEYVGYMQSARLDLAAEYLLMAAMLAEIKSRMLLPQRPSEEEEEDPRSELIRRLQEYERFKQAAIDLDELPRMERDTHPGHIEPIWQKPAIPQPDVELSELLLALKNVLKRVEQFRDHQVKREPLSVREKMSHVLSTLNEKRFMTFEELFILKEGRQGVVVTFLATLELQKAHLIELVQAEAYSAIYLQPATNASP